MLVSVAVSTSVLAAGLRGANGVEAHCLPEGAATPTVRVVVKIAVEQVLPLSYA
jgi:hypothetical protein